MSRQLDAAHEQRQRRRADKVVYLVDGGLADALGRAGAVLLGFSCRLDSGDCLVTMRVEIAGRRQVAFVGSETLGGAILKAADLARRDKLKFKEDRFARKANLTEEE